MSKKTKTLRLILGDQLNHNHSWFKETADSATYLMMEVHAESEYVKHHIQKVIAFFLSMRAFAEELQAKGFKVVYITLDDRDNSRSLEGNIKRIIESGDYKAFEYQQPDEYRVSQNLRALCKNLSVQSRCVSSEHFLVETDFFAAVFKGHKRYVMESFYRAVRKRYDLLMEDGEPLGGRWNFDAENRNKLPKDLKPPQPKIFRRDVSDLINLIKSQKLQTIGQVAPDNFTWPVTRAEALSTLK